MHAEPLYNLYIWSCFRHIEVDGTTSGPVAFLKFKDMRSKTSFAEAVLLPEGNNCRNDFDPDSYTYPIFFPNGEVEVIIHWEMDQTRSRKTMYAIITCTSAEGEKSHGMHYLTNF